MEWFLIFLLGIIALSSLTIAVGMVIVAFILVGILKSLKELLDEIKMDYKVLSPKAHKILENLEATTSIIGIISKFRKKKG